MDTAIDFWQDYWYLFVIFMFVLPGYRIMNRKNKQRNNQKED